MTANYLARGGEKGSNCFKQLAPAHARLTIVSLITLLQFNFFQARVLSRGRFLSQITYGRVFCGRFLFGRVLGSRVQCAVALVGPSGASVFSLCFVAMFDTCTYLRMGQVDIMSEK